MEDKLTETAPERIWLQVDLGASKDYRDEPFPADFDDVTWHNEELCGLEVEYVRADLVRAAMPINATDDGDPGLQRLAEVLGMTANAGIQPTRTA